MYSIYMGVLLHIIIMAWLLKVWMLTGDKLETAASIALSSRLVSRAQTLFTFKQVQTHTHTHTHYCIHVHMLQVSSRSEAHSELNSFRRKSESALIISGSSLELCIKHYEQVSERDRERGRKKLCIVCHLWFWYIIIGVYRAGMSESSSCMLPLFTHTQSTGCKTTTTTHQKTCMCHW